MKKCISEYKQVTKKKKKKRIFTCIHDRNRECATFWHYEVDILAAIFSQIGITIWCFVDELNKNSNSDRPQGHIKNKQIFKVIQLVQDNRSNENKTILLHFPFSPPPPLKKKTNI